MPEIEANGIKLNYAVTGQGEPIFFIHGLGSSGRDWEYQVDFFSPSYQVVTYDVRGHGQSGKPRGPYSIPLFAADAAALIQALQIKPAHIVGISMGGMIAFQLAVSAPALLRSLVIVNSAPALVIKTLAERLQLLQRLWIVRLLGMRKMGEVLSQRLLPKAEHAPLRELFVEHWAENNPRAYLDAMRALVNWSVADQLASIECPALVIASDHDYTSVAAKQAYASQLPNAELVVIENARHAVTVERPEDFNQILATFLAKPG